LPALPGRSSPAKASSVFIEESEHRVVAEAVFERRGGVLFLGVADHHAGVDVDAQTWDVAAGCAGLRQRRPLQSPMSARTHHAVGVQATGQNGAGCWCSSAGSLIVCPPSASITARSTATRPAS